MNQKSILSKEEKDLSRNVQNAKRFLSNNGNIIVTKADKGNVTVLMDKKQYISEIEKIFGDTKVYKRIDSSKIPITHNQLNKMVSKWHDMGIIDKQTTLHLKSNNGIEGRAYGLPKIHKE